METLAGIGRLIGFLAVLIGGLLVVGFAINSLYFALRRRNAERSASLAAKRLGLASRSDGDPRVPLWQGDAVGQAMIVAAHAWGRLGDDGPQFPFYETPIVAIVAPFQPRLRPAFVLSTAAHATQTIRTGDIAFDAVFRLDGPDPVLALAIFENDDLRRQIRGLIGPATFWSGSGRIVEVSQHGVLVRETVPRPRTTSALAADVLATALAIRARIRFLHPHD
jgi:hypothetical protein